MKYDKNFNDAIKENMEKFRNNPSNGSRYFYDIIALCEEKTKKSIQEAFDEVLVEEILTINPKQNPIQRGAGFGWNDCRDQIKNNMNKFLNK